MRPRHRLALVAAVLAMVLAAACGNRPDPLEVGLRRVALDLAFKDASKAAEVSPRQVVTQLEVVDPSLLTQVPEDAPAPSRSPKIIVVKGRGPDTPTCATAPPGAGYDLPTYPLVKDPPKVGTYGRHYTGKVKISTAAFDIDLPYPPKGDVDISDVHEVSTPTGVNSGDAAAVPAPVAGDPTVYTPKVEFKLTRHGPNGLKQVDTFQYTKGGETVGDFLWLVRRETTLNGKTSVFDPTPPIEYIKLFTAEGSGSSVTSAGIDRTTQTALAVQSTIVGRESVDVCGDVFDSFRVQIQENFVDLSQQPPVVSGNENGTANFWNIEFDHGLLLLREEVHSTYRGTTEIAGAPVPVTVTYDYVGTLDSTDPKPPRAAPGPAAPANDQPADGTDG